jgi:branched-subunit amino acid aminotransferase/4-amino-4-deoxychorismate lyase
MLAIVDGNVQPAAEASIPIADEGLLRGDGVFEVIRLYGGRPFALDAHLVRMAHSATSLRLPLDPGAVRTDVEVLLAAAGEVDAALRFLVTRGGRRIGILEPLPTLPDALALRTVTYAPTRILDQIKSLSYAANVLARRVAQEQQADEALLVTPHGRVLEGPTSTFFASLDGTRLVTPPLEDHILDSITRRTLLALVDVEERPLSADDLPSVQEAFMASTLREVHPVRSIDERALPAVPGPLTSAAADAVRAHIQEQLAGAVS